MLNACLSSSTPGLASSSSLATLTSSPASGTSTPCTLPPSSPPATPDVTFTGLPSALPQVDDRFDLADAVNVLRWLSTRSREEKEEVSMALRKQDVVDCPVCCCKYRRAIPFSSLQGFKNGCKNRRATSDILSPSLTSAFMGTNPTLIAYLRSQMVEGDVILNNRIRRLRDSSVPSQEV